jgi:signal transduction histidine kinase
VYALRPPALDEFGLLFALRELTMQFADAGMKVEMDVPERMPQLDAAIEVAVYRIAQEALTNVSRHAKASACRITMRIEGTAVLLQVSDNGCGLPIPLKPGIGIGSMRERAEELGGNCRISSAPGAGTIVSAQLPLDRGEWSNVFARGGKAADYAG